MASATTPGEQLRGFWVYYRQYTDTTAHTAATAALAIFGLLVFVDPWFAALAIGSYVAPPVVLYTLADEPVPETAEEREAGAQASAEGNRPVESAALGSTSDRSSGDERSRPTARSGNGDTDTDSDDGDIDSDGDDGDTDSDGTDTDSDSDDGDTDSDSDDGDTHSDRDG